MGTNDRVNDIALLELAESVIFRKHIAPICVGGADGIEPGATAFHCGFRFDPCCKKCETDGIPDAELKRIKVGIAELAFCRERLDFSADGSNSLCAVSMTLR